MQRRGLTAAAGMTMMLALQSAAAATYPTDPVSVATGLELAEIHCAACHAVGRDDESKLKGAPAFRDLSKRYPLEDLEESLAEGIVTGHENMPEFSFGSDDIDAFLGYLTAIQTK